MSKLSPLYGTGFGFRVVFRLICDTSAGERSGSITKAAEGGTCTRARVPELRSSEWSFRLADISIPVQLWYGEQDRPVYRMTAEFAAETIPDARLTGWPDAGHMGVAKYWREILEAVTGSH